MNHYEELGVSPRATKEEIHQAYRNAVKLLHPDRQLDPAVREIAEKQMLRLNTVAQLLLDPEQRCRYDDTLFTSRFPVEPASTPTTARFSLRKLGFAGFAFLFLLAAIIWLIKGNDTPSYAYAKRDNPPRVTASAVSPLPTSLASQPVPNNDPKPVLQSNTHRRGKAMIVVSLTPVKPAQGDVSIAPPPDAVSPVQDDGSPLPAAVTSTPAPAPPPPPAPAAISPPVLLNQVAPSYPQIAKHAHVQGTVTFLADVGEDGHVRSVSLVSGPAVLVEAAQNAVLKWQYRPAMSGGSPVEAKIAVSVEFRLD
jgi:protein TonB